MACDPTTRARSLAYARLGIYTFTLPMLAVAPLELDNPGPWYAALTVICALLFAAGAWHTYRRSELGRRLASSRALRAADTAAWNILLAIMLLEGGLTIADQMIDHPLLARPNGKSIRRIANNRTPPNYVINGSRTNSRGHNDAEWSLEPGDDSIRILALGDSFAFGVVGYEDNFLTLLEPDLSSRIGKSVEVVNMGITGLLPRDYLSLLNDEGLALHPDLVLVCFFVGNDYNKIRYASRLHPNSWRTHAFLRRIFLLLEERRNLNAEIPAEQPAPPDGEAFDAAQRAPTYSEEAHSRIARSYLLPLIGDEDQRELERDTFQILDEIVARARPIPVVIAVLPTELQVDPSLRARVLAMEGLSEQEIDLTRPVRTMREHFEPLGVPVIDLLPALARAETEGHTYMLRDTHWNVRGNRAAAAALAPALEPSVRGVAGTRAATRR